MRLAEVENGDGLKWRIIFRLISLISGMRLPDAARIIFYHKSFYGDPISDWTHSTMRGESKWTVGEREIIATMTAKWNSCDFCIGAHGAMVAQVMGNSVLESVLKNHQRPDLNGQLKAILLFLESLTLAPSELTLEDVNSVFQSGVSFEALQDAIAVIAIFNIVVRCADALNFTMLSEHNFNKAAKRMLKKGYKRGYEKTPPHANHHAFAKILEQTVMEGQGITDSSLRMAMANHAIGGTPLAQPFDDLALQIGRAAYQVTDVQIERVLKTTSSQKATFELIIASAVGAGLYRWRKGFDMGNQFVNLM